MADGHINLPQHRLDRRLRETLTLERRGAFTASWGGTDTNQRAQDYELTPKGRPELEGQSDAWQPLTAVISGVLRTT
jgi:hypothetical protein